MSDELCQLWERYHDRDLSQSEAAAFELHLTTCAECRSSLTHLENLEADILAAWCLHTKHADAPRLSMEPASLPRRRSTFWSQPMYSKQTLIGVIVAISVLIALFANSLRTNQPPRYSDHYQPPIKSQGPAAEPADQTLPETNLPEIHVTFSEPTVGSKVITLPSFSYVHVFPTVERIAKPYD